jgi:release factor glutamine methyltransferase
MSHCLHQNRAWLIAHADEVLGEGERNAFERLVDARRHGTPVAHLTASREFWSMSFEVTPDTLIPRPETEHLIECALALPLPASDISVLDFGTGSGIIAITLAKERPDWVLTAVDSSAAALKIARKNAVTHGATIDFVESNDLQTFAGRAFDVIVSNPPYIAKNDPHLKQGDVRFEPSSALSSGNDGLDCIRYLINDVPHYLKSPGYLVLEHGYDQGEAVRDLLDQRGYIAIKTDQDLGGQDRITSAQWIG